MRGQTRSLRIQRARNSANACSRLTAYPRSINHDGVKPSATITQKPRCFHRRLWMAHDPTDDFVAIAYVVIVITPAAAIVGVDKGEGGLGHV
jgi:hypothetical protein